MKRRSRSPARREGEAAPLSSAPKDLAPGRTSSPPPASRLSTRGSTTGLFGLPRRPPGEVPAPVDVLFTGVPHDGGALQRTGARFGPRAIRDASLELGGYSDALGIHVWDELRGADGGDVEVSPSDTASAMSEVARRAEEVARSGIVGGWIGGDQTVTLGVLRGLHRAKLRSVGLVHFDARTDVLGTVGAHDVHQHAVVRLAIEEGLVRPDAVVQVGVRGPHHSASEISGPGSRGHEIVKVDEIKWDVHSAVSQLRKVVARGLPLYVSVDLGVLDPSVAPGVVAPRPGGLTTWELQQLIRALVGAQIVAFDVVELSPPYDPGGLTALVAAAVLHEIVAVMADTRRSARPAASSGGKRRGRRLSP